MTDGRDGYGRGGHGQDGQDGQGRDDEATARRLIASWLADEAEPAPVPSTGAQRPVAALPAAWVVPEAAAREVVATARRLALRGLAGARPTPGADHLVLARVLVVDEHPSAPTWSERERAELAEWVAILVLRFGEEGVERLTAALAARA
ncbi:hypothetical protein ACGF13_09000 [Kitasatospora sp. NPDC048286]|uniref:hypothetical protein n=1 Tax=Kitasatospora sp. NPDC048286 TaxID=3364047 RepID=UPI003719DA09